MLLSELLFSFEQNSLTEFEDMIALTGAMMSSESISISNNENYSIHSPFLFAVYVCSFVLEIRVLYLT